MRTPSLGLSRKEPIERILSPFQEFLQRSTTGGVLLLVCTAVALIWANSPWADAYGRLWETRLSLGLGGYELLSKSLLHWINDGLMAVFFFVVGLEIKREILVGELSRPRQATLPIAAAIGGMVVPAVVYVGINLLDPNQTAMRGWGVPMATDIAFSLGVLALLGDRVPASSKIFLASFAIVDDIGATLVIAIFYTENISVIALALGMVVFALMLVANRLGIRRPLAYAILGFLLWLAFLKSGVHPTIAGVMGAMAIPARTRVDAASFLVNGRRFLHEFESKGLTGSHVLTNIEQRGALQAMEKTCELAQSPLQRLEHSYHSWVAFLIMPIFALANAGVTLSAEAGAAMLSPVAIGIFAGLVLGKQVGITFFAWLGVRLGLASLPTGLNWRHVYAIAWLGGIGFTMSLFITGLAFRDPGTLISAKIGILTASMVAGFGGWLILRQPARVKA